MKKTACVIYWDNDKYEKLGQNAANSFKFFHPDVDLHVINSPKYEWAMKWGAGVQKFMIAESIWRENGYDKMIILGADTITMGRLDEFVDNDDFDILPTWGGGGSALIQRNLRISPQMHCNADVVCFNSIDALQNTIALSIPYSPAYNKSGNVYAEQAGLNATMAMGLFSFHIVDNPYEKVYYNSSLKTEGITKHRLNSFYMMGDDVMTPEQKKIKVFHYCEAYSHKEKQEVLRRTAEVFEMFSEDVQNKIKEITQ